MKSEKPKGTGVVMCAPSLCFSSTQSEHLFNTIEINTQGSWWQVIINSVGIQAYWNALPCLRLTVHLDSSHQSKFRTTNVEFVPHTHTHTHHNINEGLFQHSWAVFYLPQMQEQTWSFPRSSGKMKLWKRSKIAFISVREVTVWKKTITE